MFFFFCSVWSVGCILGELLQMIRANCPDCRRRQILIPGACDELLSPDTKVWAQKGERLPRDQINGKKMSFSRRVCNVPVQVGAMTGVLPLRFKLKM